MGWLFKDKDKEQKTLKDFAEFKEVISDLNNMTRKLDLLETNFRIFTQTFNRKLGKLPSEEKEHKDKIQEDIEKDFYRKVLIPE